jgi:hypothetical protein
MLWVTSSILELELEQTPSKTTILTPLHINKSNIFMKNYHFPNKNNLAREDWFFFFFQMCLISGLIEDSRILVSASVFNVL